MTYQKTNWQDRLVQFPERYSKSNETTASVTLTASPGTVTQEGTPLSATNLNKLETAAEAANNELAKTTTTLTAGLQAITADVTTPADVVIRGRTLVNILGRLGNGESLTGWTTVGTVATSTIQRRSGSNSFRATSAGSPSYGTADITYPLDTNKQYVVGAWVFIESYTQGGVSLSLRDVGTLTLRYEASAITSTIGSWQFVFVKVPTANTLVGNGFRLFFGNTSTATAVAYFDDIRLYEVDAALYNAIGTTITATSRPSIDDVLPYVDSVQHVTRPSVEVVGDNLFTTFNPTLTLSNAVINVQNPNALRISSTSAGLTRAGFYDLNLLPSTVYRVKANSTRTGSSGGGILITNETGLTGLGGANSVLNPNFTFTTPTNGIVRIYFYATGGVSESSSATYTNISLTLGSADTLFKPYNLSYLYANTDSAGQPLKLAGNTVTGVFDQLYHDGADWRRLNRWVRDEAVTITANAATLAQSAVADTAVVVDNTSGAIYRRVTTLSGSGNEYTQGGTNNRTITFNASNNPTTPRVTYQRATETTEVVNVEGSLMLGDGGNHVTMSSGVVVREVVTPVLSGSTYFINSTNASAYTDFRASRILAVYRNGILDVGWTLATTGTVNGTGVASIAQASYDVTAEYTVTYLQQDRYLFTSNPVSATLEYASNVGTVTAENVRDIAEVRTDVSATVARLSNEEAIVNNHLAASMPHVMTDSVTSITYRYGIGIQDGVLGIIYEEVI